MRLYLSPLLFALIMAAQAARLTTPAAEDSRPEPKTELAQEAAIYEQISTTASYKADGTGYYDAGARVRVQSSSGVAQFGLLTFSYQKSFEDVTIAFVRVHKPDGTLISTSLDNVQDLEAEVTREAPFYSDLREKHVAVRGLAVGDVLEWSSRTKIFKPLAPNNFWLHYNFRKDFIVRDEQLRLEVPKELTIKIKSHDVQPQARVEGPKQIYVWKHSQLEHPPEDLKQKFARPFFQQPADIQISTFKSWEDVGDWYYALEQEKASPTAEVRAKAVELTKSATTEDEKVRALYDFVSTRFRYIGVSFGLGRYQPHSASDVLDNSYGDCKDKHTLLAALLDAVGVHASPALVSSTIRLDTDVPSPGQFDHLITAVHRGNDLLWLDTTAEIAPFGLLVQAVRDKQALVVEANHHSRLMSTPANPPFPSFQEVKVTGSLNEAGELKASFDETLRGDAELVFRLAFHRIPQPQWKDLVQQISQNQGYAGTVSDVVASNPENTSEPFHLTYKYDRTDYSDWVKNRRITPPTPPIGVLSLSDEYEKSGQPILLGTANEIRYVAEIRLPKDYIPQLPANVSVKTDFAVYEASYGSGNGTLHATRTLKILVNEVSPAQYAKYREFERKVTDDTSTWISFSGGTPGESQNASVSNWPLGFPPPPDSEAGRAFQEGFAELQARRPAEAIAKLEEAAKLDPKLPGVWFVMGSARLASGDVDGGLEALRRQTREFPKDPTGWRGLAFALMGMQRNSEAVPVLEQWAAVAPNDRDVPANLGRTLIALKRYKDAIPVLQKAVELNPDSESMQFSLANAFLGNGDSEAAYAQYAKAIELTDDPAIYENDAAYSLATRSIHMHDAERWAADAVKETEEQTLEVQSLDELDVKHVRLMNLLAADWDTLGYIYYRNGNLAQAEKYVSASWNLNQNSAVAEHLGDIYEQLHKPEKALRFYSLAANSPHPSDEVQDKLFRLKKAGVHEPAKWDPRAELGNMRTVRLPPFAKQHTSAEFMIMLTNAHPVVPSPEKLSDSPNHKSVTVRVSTLQETGKPGKGTVQEVKFISGSDELREVGKLLQTQDLLTEFPDDSPMRIFRRGILMCGGYLPGCQFTLLTADSVHSAN